jgi:serine/threonine-protein kinase
MSIYRNKVIQLIIVFFVLIIIAVLVDRVAMPLYVHLGNETEMPDVVEKSLEESIKILKNQGFRVVISDSIYSGNYDVGTVVKQMPLPFSVVKNGRNVYLTVSIGEKPIIMPNLFGKPKREAEMLLKTYGLNLKRIYYAYSNSFPYKGVVFAQSYPQGQKVKKGKPLTITVSMGPVPKQKTIPKLIGKSLQTVKTTLYDLNVTISNIEYTQDEKYLPGTIIGQSLEEGTKIKNDTTIDLIVVQ